MNQNKKITITYVFLFILIGIASIWILHHHHQLRAFSAKTISIDGFVDDATFTQYNAQGEIETVISAKKATHLETSGQTLFEKPNIIQYSQNQKPWIIKADHGISNQHGDQIILQNHVVIHRLPSTTMTTQKITLFPKTSQAVTDQAVTLTRPGIRIHGVGFTANFKTGEYQLHSQSKAIYSPWQMKGNKPS